MTALVFTIVSTPPTTQPYPCISFYAMNNVLAKSLRNIRAATNSFKWLRLLAKEVGE
ncbi:hypothetical protein BH11ARM2_BH11ARM2_01220 [soil metagenome]